MNNTKVFINSKMDKLFKKLENQFQDAERIALEIVEKMARQILQEHTELDEFVMAMGIYFFTYKKGGNLDPISSEMNGSYEYIYYDTEPFLKPLNDFISDWDRKLKITGEAMRFTAKGRKITKW